MISSSRRRTSATAVVCGSLLAGAFGLLASASLLGAEPNSEAPKSVPAGVGPTVALVAPLHPARPYWPELTTPQRDALAPLSTDWEHLDWQTKKKWLEIAHRYPKMKPEEQTHTQERMREWALLTPEQRRVARDSFERVRAMPPAQRADMLRRYQELPPEKREALAHQGVAGKALVVPRAPVVAVPTTAATAAPPTTAVSRRLQIREGAGVRNPVVAAQKSASPVVASPVQVRPAAPKPAEATTPLLPATTVAPTSGPAPLQPGS